MNSPKLQKNNSSRNNREIIGNRGKSYNLFKLDAKLTGINCASAAAVTVTGFADGDQAHDHSPGPLAAQSLSQARIWNLALYDIIYDIIS